MWTHKPHFILLFMAAVLLIGAACAISGSEPPAVLSPSPESVATPTLAPTATAEPVDTAATAAAEAAAGPTLAPTADPNQSSNGAAGSDSGSGDSGGSGGDGGDGSSGSGNGGSAAPAACPAGGQNLLANSSFEGQYQSYGAFRELNHAPSWTPWWRDGENNTRPEFKPAEIAIAANRVHSGSSAQQYFKSFGMFKAGVQQSILNVPVGRRLQLSAHGQAWSCEEFNMCPDGSSVNPSNMFMRVGIDPRGGIDPFSNNIKWSPYFNPLDQWQIACVEAVSESDVVTVFLWASPDGPRQNQDVYWDDASLVLLP